MDPYVDVFMSKGGMVMLAKGNRSPSVSEACAKHGGFYLGSLGGPAALLAEKCVKNVEVEDFEELGMGAVRKIDVVDFPAVILSDDKGNDFFAELLMCRYLQADSSVLFNHVGPSDSRHSSRADPEIE